MANYTLHLGFDWNSPTIGSIWTGTTNETYRFLQYAVADGNELPAWFQFQPDDVLNTVIWDLSTSVTAQMNVELSMSFGPLDAGTIQTYDPSSLVSFQGSVATTSHKTVNSLSESYLSFTNIVAASGKDSPPWGPCQGSYSVGSISFNAIASYKLSFYLKASPGGLITPRPYVSDPEVIVGSRG
jgi:hypothetical protein